MAKVAKPWVRKQHQFRPLLGEPLDPDHIDESVEYLTSPKIDGIRCLCHDTLGTVSRKLLEIPNWHVRSILDRFPRGLDGELITFTGDKMDDFNTVQGKIMSEDGVPDFKLCVFDDFTNPDDPFSQRLLRAQERCQSLTEGYYGKSVLFLKHKPLKGLATLIAEAQYFLEVHGLEGVMGRHPQSPYKYGRSTAKECFLFKVKPMDRSEGRISGFFEQMANANEATENELGMTKRSSHKAGKIPKGTLGGFFIEWSGGPNFKLATMKDITAAKRQEIWDNRPDYMHKIVSFDHQGVGTNGKPRIASFKGFRHPNDMSED